jgi:hypothetical protein
MDGEKREGTDTVEVEAVAEHQLPKAHWLDFERLDRAEESETELKMTDERQGDT